MKTHIPFSPAITHHLRPAGRISGAVGPHVPSQVKAWQNLLLTMLEQSFTLQKTPDGSALPLQCHRCPKMEPQWEGMWCWTKAIKVGRNLDWCLRMVVQFWELKYAVIKTKQKSYVWFFLSKTLKHVNQFVCLGLSLILERAGNVSLPARSTVSTVFQSRLAIFFCLQLKPPCTNHRRETQRAGVSTWSVAITAQQVQCSLFHPNNFQAADPRSACDLILLV